MNNRVAVLSEDGTTTFDIDGAAAGQVPVKNHTIFAPVDLALVPGVDALLGRIGLGAFDPATVTAPFGRNNSWAGTSANGQRVFVKQLLGTPSDVAGRMKRMLAFEEFRAVLSLDSLLCPRLLGKDVQQGLVVFELLDNFRSGAELMADEEFTRELAAVTGRMIGLLHASTPSSDADIDRTPPYHCPPLEMLRGIPLSAFENSSNGTLETWRLLQHDQALIDAVHDLRAREELAPPVPSHCDFRLDQLLISGSTVYITDWEEFRLADAARDVGAYAGEWLYRSILDIVTIRGDRGELTDIHFTHEVILERGTAKMERLLPYVDAFWASYLSVRPKIDAEFRTRATAFAGWHLLDRLLAGSEMSARLTGIARAAAGVGRGALLTPERFAAAIGFA